MSNIDIHLRQSWKVLEGIRCTWASGHSLTSFLFPHTVAEHTSSAEQSVHSLDAFLKFFN